MNKVILMGRLTRDPEVRYSQGESANAVARYTLAVDRRFKRDGDATADFINCVSFGRAAEFAEKYLRQGVNIALEADRILTIDDGKIVKCSWCHFTFFYKFIGHLLYRFAMKDICIFINTLHPLLPKKFYYLSSCPFYLSTHILNQTTCKK